MRSKYKVYDKDGIYFITSSIVEFIPVFTDEYMFEIITSSLIYCRTEMDLKLFAYVVMNNHFHAVLSAPDLPNLMKSFKRYTANKIIQELSKRNTTWMTNQFSFWKKKYKKKSSHQIWQEGYHPQQIKNEYMLQQKIDYIHNNPVRRGIVEKPEYWKYSSASNYEDLESIIEIDRLY